MARRAPGNSHRFLSQPQLYFYSIAIEIDISIFRHAGEIQLNVYNVEDFLRLAKVLSLSDLTRVCIEYLKDSLTADNCIRYLRFAKTYDSVGLVEKCQRLTQTEFYRVMSETNMEDLPEEVMVTILQDDKLVVKSELDVCEAMVRWLEKQSKVCRPVSLDPILSCIRWSGVHIEYIRSKLLSNPIMSVIRQEFLSKVVNYHLVGIPFQGLATFHRPSTGLEKCIVTVGLNNGYTIADNMYRIGLQSPNAVSCSDTVALTSTIQVEAYACAYTNMMYVSGLGEKCQEIWRWESVSGWTRCGDLRLGRRKHCAAFTGSTMYVLGGYDDSSERAMNSIEKLEVLTNRCSDSGSTSVAVHSAACVSYRNCIYIFGGADDSEKAVSHVQSFDTVSSECTLLQRTLPRPCGLMRAVMWESIAIIIGGDNCFLFNMDFQRCDEKRGFSTGVSHFGFALENERLYVIGGGREETIAKDKWKWSCTNEVKSVSVADVLKGNSVEWIKHAKLPAATMIHAYAVLSLPVEML